MLSNSNWLRDLSVLPNLNLKTPGVRGNSLRKIRKLSQGYLVENTLSKFTVRQSDTRI